MVVVVIVSVTSVEEENVCLTGFAVVVTKVGVNIVEAVVDTAIDVVVVDIAPSVVISFALVVSVVKAVTS